MLLKLLFFFLIISTALAKEVRCPKEGKSSALGFTPVFQHEAKSGQKLIACGVSEGEGEKTRFSDFKVYYHNGKKLSKAMFEASDAEFYWIKTSPYSLKMEELKFVRGDYYPFYSHEVACNKKECVKLGRLCIFKKLKKFPSEAMIDIKAYYPKGEYAKKMANDFLIAEIRDLALTGNKKAQAFFEKKPDIRLERDTLKEYNDSKDLLSRLKKSKCL